MERRKKVLELLLCLFSICHAMCVVASFPLLLHSTGCFEGKFSFSMIITQKNILHGLDNVWFVMGHL